MNEPQGQPPVPLAVAVGALALAALVGLAAMSGFYLPRAGRAFPYLVRFIAPFPFATAAVFVLPVFVLWPSARRPGYVIAAVWGALAELVALSVIYWRLPSIGQLTSLGTLLWLIPGALSGFFYCWLVDRWQRRSARTEALSVLEGSR
jgi:hypothetical protein